MQLVMVNFMCLLGWDMGCPNIWSIIYSGSLCEGVLGEFDI